MAKGKQPPPKSAGAGKKPKKEDDAEFNSLLKELKEKTKAHGEEQRREEQRREVQKKSEHEKSLEEAKKANGATGKSAGAPQTADAMLERRLQQLHVQRLIQQMMQAQRPFLPEPKTDITTEVKSSAEFDVAVSSMQGWRAQMEDAHFANLRLVPEYPSGFFGVFDGHSGSKCSHGCSVLLPVLASTNADHSSQTIDFHEAYKSLDDHFRGKLSDGSGSTAVTVYITASKITCANVGDSRAVLCRDGRAVALSDDHKPDNEDEKKRIVSAGGFVENNRTNGQLAMSRAIGDFQYKDQADRDYKDHPVTCHPDVVTVERQGATDTFVAIACDGIFDVLSNDELVNLIHAEMTKGVALKEITERVLRLCLAPAAGEEKQPARAAGTDNMTLMIVKLNQ